MTKKVVRPRLIGDPAQHSVSVAAGTAWKWIKSGEKKIEEIQKRTVIEWKRIGEGFRIGRAWARREAGIPDGTNQPIDGRLGRGFSTKFHEWLAAYGLADIDEKTRHDLSKFMDSNDIQAWHAALPDSKRLKLNHPTAIVRAWKRVNDRSAFPTPDDGKAETEKQRDRRVTDQSLTETVDRLRKELVEHHIAAQHRCDVDLMQSDVADIEKWLRARILSEHKARRLRDVLLELYPLPLPKVIPTEGAFDWRKGDRRDSGFSAVSPNDIWLYDIGAVKAGRRVGSYTAEFTRHADPDHVRVWQQVTVDGVAEWQTEREAKAACERHYAETLGGTYEDDEMDGAAIIADILQTRSVSSVAAKYKVTERFLREFLEDYYEVQGEPLPQDLARLMDAKLEGWPSTDDIYADLPPVVLPAGEEIDDGH